MTTTIKCKICLEPIYINLGYYSISEGPISSECYHRQTKLHVMKPLAVQGQNEEKQKSLLDEFRIFQNYDNLSSNLDFAL